MAHKYKHHDMRIDRDHDTLKQGDRVEVVLDKRSHVGGIVKLVQSDSALVSVGGKPSWFYPMTKGGMTSRLVV